VDTLAERLTCNFLTRNSNDKVTALLPGEPIRVGILAHTARFEPMITG